MKRFILLISMILLITVTGCQGNTATEDALQIQIEELNLDLDTLSAKNKEIQKQLDESKIKIDEFFEISASITLQVMIFHLLILIYRV